VFPLLCHTDEDEQLWNSDPIEYIRTKYGQTSTVLETVAVFIGTLSFQHLVAGLGQR